MIELITGQPGAGKTLFALTRIEDKARKEGRPVFFSGIKGLTLPWTEIEPEKWAECPPGAIVVIDECQRVLRPRMHGSKVPAYIEAMETHRHQGIDIVLITQHPMLLDANVRRLVGLHFHVVRTFGFNKSTVHEWAGVKENCDKNRDDSTRHDFRYPKKVFEWYESAQVHTHKPRLPARVLVLVAIVVLVPLLGYRLYSRWQDKAQAAPEAVQQMVPGSVEPVRRDPPSAAAPKVVTAAEYLDAHRPRVLGLAYTAPVYDGVTKPTRAPYPAACIQSRSRCQCYTQQGTRLDVPQDLCRGISEGGFFMAWDEKSQTTAPVAKPRPEVAVDGGNLEAVGINVGYEARRTPFAPSQSGQVEQQPARPRANKAQGG